MPAMVHTSGNDVFQCTVGHVWRKHPHTYTTDLYDILIIDCRPEAFNTSITLTLSKEIV